MDIKRLAERLVRKFDTRDPFKIATELGYIIIFTPLVGVRGFYQYVQRCHVIYLDTSLDTADARFVCAHELGHLCLHQGHNRIFMDSLTFMVTGRYETEADRFAVNLLFDDDDLQELCDLPLSSVATCLHISELLAEYRLESLSPPTSRTC